MSLKYSDNLGQDAFKNDDILVATRGMMNITSMISQMYQQAQVRKAHLAHERLSQELGLFEHVYNRYSGPGENAQ